MEPTPPTKRARQGEEVKGRPTFGVAAAAAPPPAVAAPSSSGLLEMGGAVVNVDAGTSAILRWVLFNGGKVWGGGGGIGSC